MVQELALEPPVIYTYHMNPNDLPEEYAIDVQRAMQILKAEGCEEIYLFGSLANGSYDHSSDIDLAIRGLAPNRLFPVYGQLLLELHHPLDLVDLEMQPAFGKTLLDSGQLVRVS